jgi:serine/threonine protein kinase
LFELLQERRTPPGEKFLIHIFLQIIEAMIYLASNHVVHGDLACRNVLVFRFDENQPERNVMKITDFGLSRHSQLYSRIPGAARTTLNRIPIRYAAPELLSSNATSEMYTEKSDVYSMGVLMWEAYCRGSLPWANIEHDADVIRRVRNGDLLPQPSNCSQPFWSIIKKTWSPTPSDRPKFSELKHLLTEQYYRSGHFFHIYSKLYS